MGLLECLNKIGLPDVGVQEKIDALVKSGKTLPEAEAKVKMDFIQKEFDSANFSLNTLKKELKLPLLKPTKIAALNFDAINKEYESSITPKVSLETQPVQEVAVPEVIAEEQFQPITVSDIEFDIKFSKDNASNVEQSEKDGDNGRSYTYTSEIETPVSNVDGDEIGYLVKKVDEDKNLTFEARDENGNNLSKNEEGFDTLGEARQALLDNHNKSKKKEFVKESKAKAKEKAKAAAKELAKKAKEKAKEKPTAPVKAEPVAETEEEQVARMMELFDKGAEATTDSGISITNKSQINNIKEKVTDKLKLKVIESAQKAIKTLKSVLPNFDIIIHENEGSYNAAMIARNGRASEAGNFSIDNKGSYSGRIDINLERANARTVAHEVAHGIMLKVFGDTPALFKNFRDRISTVLKESANQKLIEFAEQYEGDVTYEEYLAELIGTLEQQEENISPSVFQKIAAIINSVISKITNGTFKPFEDVKNTKETIEFFSGIAKSIRQGEEIITIDSKAMQEGVSLPIGSPTTISKSQIGEKISFSKNAPALSFVTEADKIDIDALINDIIEKKQKVWFWMADQLGRGNYYDEVIGKEHYLDAGPSFALDPKNRSKGILWASGLPEKTLTKQINEADYIFFISGSPEKAKLFNKRVLDLVAERINKTSNFNEFKDALNKFKKETVELNTMRDAVNGINSFKELSDSPKRKPFLLALGEISSLKTTPTGSLKELLGSFNAFINYNELRDGFYRENGFTQNDIMLVGKPTKVEGKAPHSTYEFSIGGEVVGVPDKKIDSWNIMPESLKEKYRQGNKFIDEKTGKEKVRGELSIAQKAKIVAAETGVIRELESQAANRVNKLGDLLGFDLGKPVSKSQLSSTPIPANTEVANGFDVFKKKFGETAAKAIRENIPFALDYPTEFAEFITKKIPVKEDIAFIVKNLSERLDGLFRLESDKNIETVKVKNKTPEELSKEAGYVFHRPESENDILAFKKDFENGEVLCTYNNVEGRMEGHFIFWLRRNDAESVLPARKLTQEYLKDNSEGSALWRKYLDDKGLKMSDGLYDISNINASRQDPYGTSSMSVQIGRRGGNISIKNRYNHTVVNPDATFGNDLNTIIDGLHDAVFEIEGVPKAGAQELQLPDNVTSDSKGRFFKYDKEIDNIYVSQHGYVSEGEINLIDKSYERMIDNYIFDSKKNTVDSLTMTTPLMRDINNISFEKNKIIVDSKEGKFEFELLNGFLDKLESNAEIINSNFLARNTTLKTISLPNARKINDNFLFFNDAIESISLPNVITIGNSFLRNNIKLNSISLPNVKEINDDFLRKNQELESISLPNVELIGNDFLHQNKILNSISLPNLKYINDDFLFENNALKSISLPNVEMIGNAFIKNNEVLESISLPNVKTIRNSFLYDNFSLSEISIPNVFSIGRTFLYRNVRIKNVELPNVKIIAEDFLPNNILLDSIYLPNVKIIDDYFLSDNTRLKSVELPKLESIGTNFLRGNEMLESISLPNAESIGANFLKKNEILNSISLPNVETIGEAFLNYNISLKNISLPSIKNIGNYFMISNESVERPIISKSQISNNNQINSAVNNFRAQGFAESAIKAFLIQQGYSASEANQIMNIAPIQEEFNSLMNKVDKLIARQKAKGIEDSDIASNIDIYIRKQDEYLNADDAQKKIMEREARGKVGAAPKRAVSIGRVLGAMKDITNISRKEKLKIISNIRQLTKDAAKDLAKEIRGMQSSGKITLNQAANIIARFGKVNMLSEISVSKFVEYMAKVFADAEYAAKLSEGKSLKKDISRLSKDKDKNANLRDLAKKFIKIDPSMVDDIDAYNDMASKIKEAIKGSTIRKEKVNFAETVNIKNATEYINKTIDAQNEMIRQEKAAEIQDLMDVDVSDLSYDDMMLMLDSDKPITKYNEGIIRSAINKAFKVYSSIIKNTISTGKDPFTNEDVKFTENQKRIVTEFMNMDLNKLEPKDALRAVDALVNFLQNNSIAKMDTVVAQYTALVNSNKLVEDGVKARELKKYGFKGLGKFLAEQITTLPVLFEKMFPGVNRSSYVRKMMGLTKLFNESASAKTEAKNIVNDYIKNFYKKQANGEAFNTVENNIERDMAARLMRTVIGTESEMQAEFDRRKEVLKESIAMLAEGNEQEVAKSILYQKVYDKLIGASKGVNQNQKTDNEATNIQQVKDRVDKTNLEAIDFWIKNWGDRYDRFSEVSEGVYNTMLEKELNYTPDKYSLLSLESEDISLDNEESAFNKNTGQEYKKSGTLNKVKQPGAKELRQSNRYLNLDFDQNMANLMQDALIDINTAASIKQVMAFLNSPNFRKIFPNQDDAIIVKGNKNTIGRVQLYINNLRSKNYFTTDELSSAMKKLDKVSALGVTYALGSVGQIPKQTFSIAVNTLLNSGSLPVLSILTNIDKINFINNSGRDIANRGASAQTEIESINKLIEKAASSKGEELMRFIEKANEKWLKLFLVNPDVFIAKASWLTYYEQSLKKQGIDTNGLDYKTHELNDKAADYASAQVGRQQNISDHDMAGKLFSNQDVFAKFVVKTVFSFASFRMNAASRLGADLTTLNDKTSTKEDRTIAVRSIVGFGAELAVFSLVSIALNVLWGSLTKFISGDEEDEDELRKRIKLAAKARLSSAPSDIFSPLPILDPFIQKYLGAPALEKIEKLTNLPVSIYDKPNNSGLFSEFGILGIAADRIDKIIELGKLAATGKYTDDYGNENTISEEKRKKLALFVPLSILASVGLIPQEGNTIAMNAMKYAKNKTAGDTALARRALKDWASMVDLNEYPQVAEFIKSKGQELSGSGEQFRKIKDRNELKKSLLDGYESENQMQEVDPELYQNNFGENSDWVKKGYATEDIIYSELNSELNTMINELKTQELRKKVNK